MYLCVITCHMYIYRFFISIIYDTITLLFCFYKTKPLKFRTWILTLNCWGRGGEINLTPCLPFWFFQKSIFWREGQILIFVTFNIIISHIFPENFIKISQVVQKIWRFSTSILTNFINLWDFFHIFFNFHPF